MRWKFWKPRKSPDPPEDEEGLARAQEALKDSKQQHAETEALMERHRKVRERNGLGPLALDAMRRRGA